MSPSYERDSTVPKYPVIRGPWSRTPSPGARFVHVKSRCLVSRSDSSVSGSPSCGSVMERSFTYSSGSAQMSRTSTWTGTSAGFILTALPNARTCTNHCGEPGPFTKTSRRSRVPALRARHRSFRFLCGRLLTPERRPHSFSLLQFISIAESLRSTPFQTRALGCRQAQTLWVLTPLDAGAP